MTLLAPASPPASSGLDTPFLEAADRIGAALCRDALRGEGRAAWLAPAPAFREGRWTSVTRRTGPDLYAGGAGVALFLLHLHAATGERLHRRTAEAALAQVLASRGELAEGSLSGVYAGRAGLLLVLVQAALLLQEARWWEAARTLADEVVEGGAVRGEIDVIVGSAGALPLLLELARTLDDPRLEALARAHGELLLASAVRGDPVGRGWSWPPPGGGTPALPHLTGFAHGASGVAWALLELHAHLAKDGVGDGSAFLPSSLQEAALGAMRFERARFVPEEGNWEDLRDHRASGVTPGTRVCGLAWCHGAPGIGLARMRALAHLGAAGVEEGELAPVRDDAAHALATTRRALQEAVAGARTGGAPLPDATPCHGLAGWTDLLLLVGADGEARVLWQEILSRHDGTGRPWPCGVRQGGEVPGLMTGIAGVGVLLLRLGGRSLPWATLAGVTLRHAKA